MLEEHRSRQNDIGDLRCIGHELFMHTGEQVLAQETFLHQPLLGRDIHRIGVLDKQRRHRRAAIKRIRRIGEHGADARMIEIAHLGVPVAVAFKQILVELEAGNA